MANTRVFTLIFPLPSVKFWGVEDEREIGREKGRN